MLFIHHPHIWTSLTALFVALWTGAAWWYVCHHTTYGRRRQERIDYLLGKPLR